MGGERCDDAPNRKFCRYVSSGVCMLLQELLSYTGRVHVAGDACLFTSLAILGHCPVLPDQEVWARSHAPCDGLLQQYNAPSRSVVEM